MTDVRIHGHFAFNHDHSIPFFKELLTVGKMDGDLATPFSGGAGRRELFTSAFLTHPEKVSIILFQNVQAIGCSP